jgi:hypothetical protein
MNAVAAARFTVIPPSWPTPDYAVLNVSARLTKSSLRIVVAG